MTSIAQLKGWSNVYPFDEGELEIILRCYNSIVSPKGQDKDGSFLSLIAHSFPYVFFFLPKDEIENRIALVEKHILPETFGEGLKRTLFPAKGTESEDEAMELLIQGFAKCCKGDSKETLGAIFDCCPSSCENENLVRLCYDLNVASSVLVAPNINEESFVSQSRPTTTMLHLHGLVNSLETVIKVKGERATKDVFIEWGLKCIPHLGSVMASFMHNLLFHGKSEHSRQIVFGSPTLLDSSQIFNEQTAAYLFTISCMSADLGGKWRRLYSSVRPDTSMTSLGGSLEEVMAEYVGPSIFVIKMDEDHIIGGVAESGWVFGYFLFEVEPLARIHCSRGQTAKYFIKKNTKVSDEHGNALTGTGFFTKEGSIPDLFISEHFHWCKGAFLDVPFSKKVEAFEVWAVEECPRRRRQPSH